ncbi:MAG: prenyltransferase [Desulfobaccales bacterium]|nr:prenyltransferase [Desulfobaccales bacterium]
MAAGAPGALAGLLSPLSLLLAGLIPFLVGTLLAGVAGFEVRLKIVGAGALAVAALILAAGASRQAFSPGAGRWPTWGSRSLVGAGRLAYGSLTLAAFLGLLLQFGWHTGDLTIPLGGLGILGGYFYFAPPLAWHRRGWGEAVGGLCFGLLPVVSGFYLQCGHLVTEVLLYGLPLTFAAFNLFLLQGFPNPQQEAQPQRHNLAEILGPAAGALIYTLVNILTITGLVFCLFLPPSPLPLRGGLWLLLLLAIVNQELIKRKAYRQESRLKLLGRLTLTLHLSMGLMFTLMLWRRL